MWLRPWWPGINESLIRDGQVLLSWDSNHSSSRFCSLINHLTAQPPTPAKKYISHHRHQDHQPAGPHLPPPHLKACKPACATVTGPQILAQLRPC